MKQLFSINKIIYNTISQECNIKFLFSFMKYIQFCLNISQPGFSCDNTKIYRKECENINKVFCSFYFLNLSPYTISFILLILIQIQWDNSKMCTIDCNVVEMLLLDSNSTEIFIFLQTCIRLIIMDTSYSNTTFTYYTVIIIMIR